MVTGRRLNFSHLGLPAGWATCGDCSTNCVGRCDRRELAIGQCASRKWTLDTRPVFVAEPRLATPHSAATTLKPSDSVRFAAYVCARLRATISELSRVRSISVELAVSVFKVTDCYFSGHRRLCPLRWFVLPSVPPS